MMQTAEPGERDNLAELGRLDAAMIRRVLAQGQVHSVVVVPVAGLAKQAPCVLFGQHDDVIEALAAKGADHSLCEGVHQRRPHGCAELADAEVLHPLREGGPVGSVPIADQESRRRVPREAVDDLLSKPFRGRVRGHVREDQTTAFQAQDDEDVEDLEADRRMSTATMSRAWFLRRVAQVCDLALVGAGRARARYRDTVRSETT